VTDDASPTATDDEAAPRSAGDADRTTEDTPLGPVEAVCFDLDDTLFDYTQYIEAGLRSAAGVIQTHTGENYADELVRLYFEEDVRDGTFDHLLEREGLAGADDLPDDLTADLVEAYHDHDADLAPYDESHAVLSTLDGAFRLGLVTDGRNGHWKLDRLDFANYFDAVVVTPDHDLTKTEPEPFRRALDALDADPDRTVFVGDNPRTDCRVPNRLGMTTVRLARGRYVDRDPEAGEEPDVVVESLARLPDLLNVAAGTTP
jgi:putative hydrolase of the HAD superfamily